MKEDEKKALFFELVDTLFQSWWTIVAGLCVGAAAAHLALGMVDKLYVATAKIYITPEISPQLGRPIVVDDMTRRMAGMKDAVLSQAHLQEIVDELYGHPDSPGQLDSRIRRVRRSLEITPTASGPSMGREGLYAFDLSYTDTRPERAARAANLVAELYIRQNEEFRTEQAEEAAAAAEEQANEAKADYDEANSRLTQFKEEHRFETERDQDANLRMMEVRQNELIKSGEIRRANETKLEGLRKSSENELIRLRRELDELLAHYSEQHPQVIRQRRRLADALMTAHGETGDGGETGFLADPAVAELRGQIEAVERELEALDVREATLREEIALYERRIAAVPHVQPTLSRLETEAGMLRGRYEKLRAAADQTRQSLFLEETLRGGTFELAERAQVPFGPFYPDPKRFYTVGLLGCFLLFVSPLFAWRFLNPVISSESGLRALTDVPVLVVIPRIITPATRGYRLRRTLKNFVLSTVFAALAASTWVLL